MKFRLFQIITLAFALSLGACDSNDNDDDDDDNIPGATGQMEASIDGSQWTAVDAWATTIVVGIFMTMAIAGETVNEDRMTITFVGNVPTGTYTLGDGLLSSMSLFEDGGGIFATTGTVTITTINTDKVKGTFSFEATRFSDGADVSVTSGSFDVEFGINIGS